MILWMLALACTRTDPNDTGPLLDTGWFEDTSGDTDPGVCPDVAVSVDADGSFDWYWRDAPVVSTTSDLSAAYDGRLIDAIGIEMPSTLAWEGLSFAVVPDEALEPLTDYTVEVTDCTGTRSFGFSTSSLGLPLEDEALALVGRTFAIDLRDADWVEPPGFGALLSLYFDQPVLLGVQWADERTVDLLGAQGQYDGSTGIAEQSTSEPTWDYPLADFEDQPYFEAEADEVVVALSGAEATLYGFTLSATWAPDGASLGGGKVSGLGDTRNLGPLVNLGEDPNAICDLATGMGAECVDCPDGEPYCLFLAAEHVEGYEVPGLVLSRVED